MIRSALYRMRGCTKPATSAAIWRELLQLDRVGRQANFFEIGGHSLLANKLTLRIENEFNLTFPLIEVFRHPTLRDMAMAVCEMQLRRFNECPLAEP